MTFHGRIALLALGALALVLPASASAETATKHHLEMYKAEQHITLPEYDTNTYTLACPGNDLAADGMWRIDEVGPYNAQLADDDEAPWTVATGVSVIAAYPSASDTYTFTFRNNTSSNAQLKIFVTCLGDKTAADTHSHDMVASPIATQGYNYAVEDEYTTAPNDPVHCASGQFFISPGFKVNSGEAYLFASKPETNLYEWTYGFYVSKPATSLNVYGRCLENFTDYVNGFPKNHRHKIYGYLKTTAQHFDKGNGVWEHQIECGEHQKGLVGGFDVFDPSFTWNSHSWYWLGMDPRIKTRAFRTMGTGSGGGSYYLVCFNDRTSRPFYS
ncbi:MAG TPA: hypothetical protein VFR97_00395 [Capillimicrobium sp.]|nr:hypothetical protein [Capillimicrobium sp.]